MLKKQGTNNYYSFAQFTSQIDRSGILYNKALKDLLSIRFSQIQTINYNNNLRSGEAYTCKSQYSCSFPATCYFSGIPILEPGTSNSKASISNSKAGVSNSKAGVSISKAGVSNSKAGVSNSKAGVSNSKASISISKAGTSNSKAGISNDGAIVPIDRPNLSIDGVYISRNENNISFTLPIRFKAERSKSLNPGITAITKHLTVELSITFNIKLFNYLIYG